jgi:hypothetical protein
MSDPQNPKPGAGQAPRQERRRTARHHVRVPIRVTMDGETLEGTTDNFSYNGVLVTTERPLPGVGTLCEFALELPLGVVRAHAKVVRRDETARCFALDVTRIDSNGQLLLVALILEGE